MPSPFPGMDPYLEDPERFPDLHDCFVVYLSEYVQEALPQPYFARIGRRVWIEITDRYIEPDVQVLRPERGLAREADSGGGTATLAPAVAKPVLVRVPHDERRETLVEIFTPVGSDKRLVTSIEVLSLSNKTPGAHGRDLYLRKQQEILSDSAVHLVEIDLLRGGEHTTAVPYDRAAKTAGPFDYHVCVHRFDSLEDFFVYPILLTQKLPTIAIPLLPNDADVTVDLQAVFQRCYEAGRYDREIRYQQEQPIPPLPADLAAWSQALLDAARSRP